MKKSTRGESPLSATHCSRCRTGVAMIFTVLFAGLVSVSPALLSRYLTGNWDTAWLWQVCLGNWLAVPAMFLGAHISIKLFPENVKVHTSATGSEASTGVEGCSYQ